MTEVSINALFSFYFRWTEEKDNTELELQCTFKVDEYGFFVYWKSEGKEGDVIELCQVSDIRAGGLPKVIKLTVRLQKTKFLLSFFFRT